jgi:hypothetical protein
MDYGMFSKAGNAAVARIITDVMSLPIGTTDQELYAYLNKRMTGINPKHPEIYDTAVRDAIISVLERKLNRELTIYF